MSEAPQQQQQEPPVSEEVLTKTKAMLSSLISNPVITEKFNLLSRPPFRFIQLIVQEIISKTGFANGLYTNDEFAPVKDSKEARDLKLIFLQKIIQVVSLSLKRKAPCKAMFIAAGKEAENTNLFLQMFAEAAQQQDKLDWKKAVEQVLSKLQASTTNTETPSVATPAPNQTAQPTTTAQQPAPQPTQQTKPQSTQQKPAEQPAQQKPVQPSQPTPQQQQPQQQQTQPQTKPTPQSTQRPVSAVKTAPPPITQPPVQEITVMDPQQAPAKPARPSTAKRAPPKQKSNVREVEETQQQEQEKKSVLIVENQNKKQDNDSDDEESTIIIVENEVQSDQNSNEKKGQLVENLLQNRGESSKEQPNLTESTVANRKGIVLGAKKENEKENTNLLVTDELTKLKQSIQIICRSTNPLGKTMDYIQEDLDSMIKELEIWKKESLQQSLKLQEEQAITVQECKAMENSLYEIEQLIQEKSEKIQSVKASILKNDSILEQLLKSIINS